MNGESKQGEGADLHADLRAVRDYFDGRQDEMLAAIQELVAHETPSLDKARLDAFAEMLAARLEAVGATVEILPNATRGNHVRAQFPATRPVEGGNTQDKAQRPALILCHFDTVWPVGALETHPVRVEAGKAYGPGIFDMKCSLVLAEYTLRAIGELQLPLTRPVTVLMTADEELGSETSRALIESEAQAAAYVLVMESPLAGGVLKTRRKGVGRFSLEVQGRAVHAGIEPEKGASAIQELALQILALHDLTDMEQGTTVNVGVVQGGSASNVVAAQATAEIDTRAWTQAEAGRIEQGILGLQAQTPNTTVSVSGGWNRPPLERSATGALFAEAQAIGQTLGLTLEEGATGGGSDGNFTGALDVPTLDGLGVPGDGAHADHEHILVDRIAERAALLTALVLNL